ncbi:acyltransferase family protein [Nocardioides kribbensis]|uniref:Acyltransferase family protein n=1 Tax=Nocardioides kribbensis TaxID=305517 RepID=A0ABV1NX31_9ACTN
MSPSPARATHLRTDVQGLRAVAVVTVVLGHLDLGPLTGGFVGVDVFFVVSGFLITQLMLREVARTGGLSLTDFYARRARRILPAASLVLVATAVASALWLGPLRAPEAFVDVVWAAAFAANVRFAERGTDYFALDLSPSPVQHYWSLAVEEQFYVVWPLLLLAVVLLARRRHRARASDRAAGPDQPAQPAQPVPLGALAGVLVVVAAASLAWSAHRTGETPTAAYFSSLTRAWELALGALGAVAVAAWPARRTLPRAVVEPLALAGLAAVGWACLRLTPATPFPGTAALVPVLGTLAVLLAGATATRSLVDRALSLRALQLLGGWSYSIYLWHWPLVVIPSVHVDRALTLGEKIALAGLTLLLAALTTRLVEDPVRRARGLALPWRGLVLYPTTLALVVSSAVAAGAYVQRTQGEVGRGAAITLPDDWRRELGTDDPATALVRASARASREGRAVPRRLSPPLTRLLDSTADLAGCDYRDDTNRELCPRGDQDAERTVVLLGDSHARHWIPALEPIAEQAGYRAYYLAKPQCVPWLVTSLRGGTEEPFTACDDFKRWALEQVERLQPDLVVVSSSPGTSRGVLVDGEVVDDPEETARAVRRGTTALLERLDAAAGRTVLLADVPILADDPGPCLSSRPRSLRACLTHERPDHRAAAAAQVRAADASGVASVRTRQWFCAGDDCPAVVGSTVPYRDGGHVTTQYAEQLARPLGLSLGLLRRRSSRSAPGRRRCSATGRRGGPAPAAP